MAAISKLFVCNEIFRGRVASGYEFTNRICWTLTKRSAYRGRGKNKVVIFQHFCHKASDPDPLTALLATHVFPLFLLQLNLTYMKRILHLVSVKISLLSILLSSLAAATAGHFVFFNTLLGDASLYQYYSFLTSFERGGGSN